MRIDHYSALRAKSSLVHFVAGKAVSAITGISYLILLVRFMQAEHYGGYIALIALIELFYLSTGLGLSTIAQRYVAEFRVKASGSRFHRFLGRIFLWRLGLSVLFSMVVVLGHQLLLPMLGLEPVMPVVLMIVVLLVASASVFFLDAVLGALLYQGLSQGLGVMRGVMKLSAVIYAIQATGGITIEWVLLQECIIVTISLAIGHAVLHAKLRALPDHGSAGNADAARDAGDDYANPNMLSTARKFYVVQLLGQTYAPSASKLIVTRILGLGNTAAFGFAQSIADMLRNYLPAHLLAGWLRPIMVSRYLARRDLADLTDISNLVLKLNLLGIVPLAVFFLFRGDAFAYWITGGRYPQAGNLLVLLTLMVGLQTVHLMFSMITITLEQASANLVATVLAAASLPMTVALIYTFGIEGAAWGLLASETIWLLSAGWLLARRGYSVAWDVRGALRIFLAGSIAGLGLWLSGFDKPVLVHMLSSAAIVGIVFLVVSALLKPLRERERALVRGIMPGRLVVW